MIVAFSISPTTGDETGGVSEAVAAAVWVVRESGLPNETNAMFTNIEGATSTHWHIASGERPVLDKRCWL